MRIQLNHRLEEFDRVDLDLAFPVSTPPLNIRGDISPDPPHVHDCLELGYCYDGSGIFTVEGKIFRFKAGDVSVVNHRELHQMVSLPGSVCRWRFCYLDPLPLLAGILPPSCCLDPEPLCGPEFTNIIQPTSQPGICTSIHELIEEMLEKKIGYQSLVRSLTWGILQRLVRIIPQTSDSNKGKRSRNFVRKHLMRIRPAMDHISQCYGEEISITRLAALCGLSPSRFRCVFSEATGHSPAEYLVTFRVNAAASLLQNHDAKIIDVAFASGYPTLSNFNRHFKEIFHVSPRQYRNRPGERCK